MLIFLYLSGSVQRGRSLTFEHSLTCSAETGGGGARGQLVSFPHEAAPKFKLYFKLSNKWGTPT